MTLAALEATLRSYRRGRATDEIPIWQMISAPVELMQTRAESWQQRIADCGIVSEIWTGESAVGGGSLPGETLPTRLLAIPASAADTTAARLRRSEPSLVCRIQNDTLLFDPRTVLPEQDEQFCQVIQQIFEER